MRPPLASGSARSAIRPGNQKRPFVPGRKVVPSAVPPSFGDAALGDRQAAAPLVRSPPIGAALYRWRSAPEPTGSARVTAPLAVRSGGSRVHSPPSPLRFPPATGSLCRRFDGYSSRSQPALRDVAGSLGVAPGRVNLAGEPGLEPGAGDHRQAGVSRESGVRSRALAQDEDRAAVVHDPPRMTAAVAQAGGRRFRAHRATVVGAGPGVSRSCPGPRDDGARSRSLRASVWPPAARRWRRGSGR